MIKYIAYDKLKQELFDSHDWELPTAQNIIDGGVFISNNRNNYIICIKCNMIAYKVWGIGAYEFSMMNNEKNNNINATCGQNILRNIIE